MINTLPGEDVRKVVNPHCLSFLPINAHHRIALRDPKDLHIEKKFDVMAKYIYAKQRMIGGGMKWAKDLYMEHLRCFSNYKEGDGAGKNSFDEYVSRFDSLLDSIVEHGFIKDKGYLPVDRHGIPLEGSHRLAACLLHDKPLYTVEFDVDADNYDYKYFLNRGLGAEVTDPMALELVKKMEDIYVAVVFPLARTNYKKVVNILINYGCVVYEKDVVFSKLGRRNLIKLLYRGENWLGKDGELTKGLLHHSENRFLSSIPVSFLFIKCNNSTLLREAKHRVRSLFNSGNDPIHASDSREDTIRIAELVLNNNSIHHINFARVDYQDGSFIDKFKIFRDIITSGYHDKNMYCIDGGGVLALYGIRKTRDLDYLHYNNDIITKKGSDISSHNDQMCYFDDDIGGMIFDPKNYFYYEGVKCISIDNVKKAKVRRRCKKDCDDIKYIDSLQKKVSWNMITNGFLMLNRWKLIRSNLFNYGVFKIKRMIPKKLYPIAKKIYKIPLYAKEYCGPYNRVMNYKGYRLHYTRGTSLIKRIWRDETYEPEVTYKIIEELRKSKNPVLMDVGANIGLMTLNVVAALPNVEIYAFEPGVKQCNCLNKTVINNKIENNVTVYRQALGNNKGQSKFYVHKEKHSSGDGFIDTKMAGKTKIDYVNVITVDGWWRSSNFKKVDVIKIDTEGSELWVLQGAKKFISQCRPKIFLEIGRKNVKVYPFRPHDIYNFLNDMQYLVYTIAGLKVDEYSLDEVLIYNEMFMAIESDNIRSSCV